MRHSAYFIGCFVLLWTGDVIARADDSRSSGSVVPQASKIQAPTTPPTTLTLASVAPITPKNIQITSSPTIHTHGCASSEIFEVSTRHLPDQSRCICFEQTNVEVNRLASCHWVRSSIDEVFPMDGQPMLTIIYVHGNFMERCNALERVRIVDSYLKQYADQPYRLIMLSWPSQRERKPLRDVLSNAECAEAQSLYFAWMLQRLRNQPQVSILGFSFGARAVTGGLHLDAGGCIPGFMLTPNPDMSSSPKYRVGLVAPAIDRNWIEPTGRHGQAMTHVDSLINLYNSRDPILRRFRFLDRLVRPVAAGFAGFESVADPIASSPLTASGEGSRIRQYDCGSIGTTHAETSYYSECPYFRNLILHLLWKETLYMRCDACGSR